MPCKCFCLWLLGLGVGFAGLGRLWRLWLRGLFALLTPPPRPEPFIPPGSNPTCAIQLRMCPGPKHVAADRAALATSECLGSGVWAGAGVWLFACALFALFMCRPLHPTTPPTVPLLLPSCCFRFCAIFVGGCRGLALFCIVLRRVFQRLGLGFALACVRAIALLAAAVRCL